MDKRSQRESLTLFTFSLVLVLGIVGYVFINQQNRQRLSELEKEAKLAEEKAKTIPSPRTESLTVPFASPAKKNSLLSVQAEKPVCQVGGEIQVELVAQSPGEVIDGIDLIVSYDPKKIKAAQPTPGNFFPLYPQMEVDNQQGWLKVIALQDVEESKSLDQAIVANLSITCLAPGRTKLEIVKEKSHLAGYAGQNLLKDSQGLEIMIR